MKNHRTAFMWARMGITLSGTGSLRYDAFEI